MSPSVIANAGNKAHQYDDLTRDRMLVKQSPIRDTLYVYDVHLNQVSVAESDMEADRIIQLMSDPNVAKYEAQRFSCYPFPDNKKRRYTLDNLVISTTGELFEEEVKPKARTLSPEFAEKHRIIADYALRERQATHRVVTEEDIHEGALIDNLRYLLTRKNSACPRTEGLSFRCATGIGITTVSKAQDLARIHGFDPDIIARCIAHRLLACDLTIRWPDIVIDFSSLG